MKYVTGNFVHYKVSTCSSCPLLSGSVGNSFCNHPHASLNKQIIYLNARPKDCPLLRMQLHLVAVEIDDD